MRAVRLSHHARQRWRDRGGHGSPVVSVNEAPPLPPALFYPKIEGVPHIPWATPRRRKRYRISATVVWVLESHSALTALPLELEELAGALVWFMLGDWP